MISYRTSRNAELVADVALTTKPVVPEIDRVCPGWEAATVHIVDGVSVYELTVNQVRYTIALEIA